MTQFESCNDFQVSMTIRILCCCFFFAKQNTSRIAIEWTETKESQNAIIEKCNLNKYQILCVPDKFYSYVYVSTVSVMFKIFFFNSNSYPVNWIHIEIIIHSVSHFLIDLTKNNGTTYNRTLYRTVL